MQKSKIQINVFEVYKSANFKLFLLLKELIGDINEEDWNLKSIYTFLSTASFHIFF